MTPSKRGLQARNPAALHTLVAVILSGTCLLGTGNAAAQAGAPEKEAPSERAKRDADKVFQMILMHGDKPRRVREDRPVAAPAAAVPLPVARSAAGLKGATAAVAETAPAAKPPGAAELDTLPSTVRVQAPDPVPATPAVTPPSEATPATVASPAPAAIASAVRNTQLEVLASGEPEFPASLVRRLGSGSVLVQFEVDTDGRVTRTEVLHSSHRGLNAAAQEAVATWRFKPVTEVVTGMVELRFE